MKLSVGERVATLELGDVCVLADLDAGAVTLKAPGLEKRRMDALVAHLVYRELVRIRSVAMAFSRTAAEEEAAELIKLLAHHLA